MRKFFLVGCTLIFMLGCQSAEKKSSEAAKNPEPGTNLSLAKAGLSEKDVTDAYVYMLGRYLVIRQERNDIMEKNLGYNRMKYNPLGKAEFVNPNLDVAYNEAWLNVDEKTCQVLEVPKITNRYYTVQVLDEWASIITNINERNYPDKPYGKFAFCMKGAAETPTGAYRIDVPSYKVKILTRVERKGSDSSTIELQKKFKLIANKDVDEEPPQKIPMFTNANLIGGQMFEYPMVETVLRSAPDPMKISQEMQTKVRAVAKYAAQSDANKKQIELLVEQKSIPQFLNYVASYSPAVGGWKTTLGHLNKKYGFGEDYWFRSVANYGGIWANSEQEAIYFSANKDADGNDLNGRATYIVHFEKADLPKTAAKYFWSMTVLGLPDYRVIPNPINRYNLSTASHLTYGRDGSLTFAIGAKPNANIPLSNWIPGPDGKNFEVVFRTYGPMPKVLVGDWKPGPIRQIEGFKIQKTSQR